MRSVTPAELPSLFSPELLAESLPVAEESKPDDAAARIARDFVRWCCSFGSDFRNSPDITNLRFWQKKTQAAWSAADEDEILVEARRLFLKKLEQAVRKADVPKTTD